MRSPPKPRGAALRAGRSHQARTRAPEGPHQAPRQRALQSTRGQDSRPPSLPSHLLGDRQTDRQTGHSAWLSRHRLGDRWTEGPLWGRRPPGGASSARRLHLVEDAPPMSWRGKPALGVRGSPVGWRCRLPAPPLCLRGLRNTSRPCAAAPRNNHGGISSNRWRTAFSSSCNRAPHSSLRGVPVRHRTDAQSRRIAPGSSCCAGTEQIHLSPFRGISIQQTRRKEWKVVLSPAAPYQRTMPRAAVRQHRCFAGSGAGQPPAPWPPAPRAAAEQPFPPRTSRRSAAGHSWVFCSLLDVLPSLRFICHLMRRSNPTVCNLMTH